MDFAPCPSIYGSGGDFATACGSYWSGRYRLQQQKGTKHKLCLNLNLLYVRTITLKKKTHDHKLIIIGFEEINKVTMYLSV